MTLMFLARTTRNFSASKVLYMLDEELNAFSQCNTFTELLDPNIKNIRNTS